MAVNMIKSIVNEVIWCVKNKWFFLRHEKFVTKEINPRADLMQKLSDEELLRRSQELQHRSVHIKENNNSAEACALICEAILRCKGKRPSDTQLIGSMLINEGRIVKIDSGEDISILFLPAIYMAIIGGLHVHVVFKEEPPAEIVDFARSVFKLLGITVGCVTPNLDPSLDKEYCMKEYACDVIYGSYSTFGLYYLRNNLKNSIAEQLPLSQDFAIINEADNILLDNVRQGLVVAIPTPPYFYYEKYKRNDTLAKIMVRNYFKLYKKLAGVAFLSKMYQRGEFSKVYGLAVVPIPASHPDNSLKPNNRIDYDDYLYRDKKAKYQGIVEEVYRIIESGRPVVIATNDVTEAYDLKSLLSDYGIRNNVIEYLHEKSCTTDIFATIGHQYRSVNGHRIGNVTIFNKPLECDFAVCLGIDVICEKCRVPAVEKLRQLNLEIENIFPSGAIKCCINCPQYDKITNCTHCFKNRICEEFPLRGRVECCKNVPCGLHIIVAERNLYRRFDNDILSKFIRCGEPGSSRFFLSLDDEFMKASVCGWTVKALSGMGWVEGEPICSRRINKSIRKVQDKNERRDFEEYKNSFYYDDILYDQMFLFYSKRQRVLRAGNTKTLEVYDMAWRNHLCQTDGLMTRLAEGLFIAGLDPKVLYAEDMEKMFQKMTAELPEFRTKG